MSPLRRLLPIQKILHDIHKAVPVQRRVVDQAQLLLPGKRPDLLHGKGHIPQRAIQLYHFLMGKVRSQFPENRSGVRRIGHSVHFHHGQPDRFPIRFRIQGNPLQVRKVTAFKALLSDRVIFQKTSIIAPEFQQKLFKPVLGIIPPGVHFLSHLAILLQNPLKAGPVGTVLPVFILNRIRVAAWLNYSFPVLFMIKQGQKQVAVLLKKMRIIIIRVPIQHPFMKPSVIVRTAGTVQQLNNRMDFLYRFHVIVSDDPIPCGFFQALFQQQGLIHRLRSNHIAMLQLPEPVAEDDRNRLFMHTGSVFTVTGYQMLSIIPSPLRKGLYLNRAFPVLQLYDNTVPGSGLDNAGAGFHHGIDLLHGRLRDAKSLVSLRGVNHILDVPGKRFRSFIICHRICCKRRAGSRCGCIFHSDESIILIINADPGILLHILVVPDSKPMVLIYGILPWTISIVTH